MDNTFKKNIFYSVPYGLAFPEVKHSHHAKYVVIHEYDDKDDGDKGYYYGPSYGPTYSHISSYDSDKDKDKYDFDHDHYHFVHGFDDGDKDGHALTFINYGNGYNHGPKEAEKLVATKKLSKLPKKFIAKDNGKKYEYTYYDDYSLPTAGFKEDFIKPKQILKPLSGVYEVKSQKPAILPLKIVGPTKATLISYGPTQSTYKNSYVGPTVISYVDSAYNVNPKTSLKPTIVPYIKKYHSKKPLSAEFEEYNARKQSTEEYVHAHDKAPFTFPASHLQSPQFDSVKDGIIGFATEISEQFEDDEPEPEKNTLEQFRKEDEQDAKEHEEFVTSIENDHKTF